MGFITASSLSGLTTAYFDKCDSNCALRKERNKQLSYCFNDKFIRQTLLLEYTCHIFAWSLWSRSHDSHTWSLTIRRTARYWLSTHTHKQVTSLLAKYKRVVGTQQASRWWILWLVSYLQSVINDKYFYKCTIPKSRYSQATNMC
jgi:hypothetical protein